MNRLKAKAISVCLGVALLGSVLLAAPSASAQQVDVEPYLQLATPTSIWVVWETSSGTESTVEWGLSASLGSATSGTSRVGEGASRVHEVQLNRLQPGSRYHYRVRTGAYVSAIETFRTPSGNAEESSRIALMSDMQKGERFTEIVEDGIIGYLDNTYGGELEDDLSFVMIPGDLVGEGYEYWQWEDLFFGPAANLLSRVPVYPVPGNHEYDSQNFFDRFILPQNGSAGYEEHWWYFDQANVRIVGLDSTYPYLVAPAGSTQLNWLTATLEDACVNPDIDFVFAQLHHPFESELWVPGNTPFTGDVIDRLVEFTAQCDKPSAHFYGHTHGYARGVDSEHEHAMVNVAGAGGLLDRWGGPYEQQDYAEFSISESAFGFVLADVQAGSNPSFTLTRISRGGEGEVLPNEVTDTITIYLNNQPPAAPSTTASWNGGSVTLARNAFSDPDGDGYGATQWQVATSCATFGSPLVDVWRQSENIFYGVDLLAGVDQTRLTVDSLNPAASYCVRVRVRDASLAWSAWSTPLTFTGSATNLLVNGGAESGVGGWTGAIESLLNGECDGAPPHSGTRAFAVGGVCANESAFGQAVQTIDVTSRAGAIDANAATFELRGFMRNFGGADRPSFFAIFRNAAGGEISRTNTVEGTTNVWTENSTAAPVPSSTRSIDVVLVGTRNDGSDNDSYFDDLSAIVSVDGPQPFACSSDAGQLNWSDDGQSKYWIYKSTDNGASYLFLGRTFGATAFTDTNASVGARYQVHYEGIPRVNCTIINEPAPGPAFACSADAGVLSWTDAGQNLYWVYRSLDGGASYNWIGRSLGPSTFTDPTPAFGARYQVHYAGIPRSECAIIAEPSAGVAFACSFDNGVLTWPNAGQNLYWVYRSTDNGASYSWIGRTTGATSFTVPSPAANDRYQVHYAGIPRANCV